MLMGGKDVTSCTPPSSNRRKHPPNPQGVHEVAQMLMGGKDVAFVDCVKGDDGPSHKSIKQARFGVRTRWPQRPPKARPNLGNSL